MSGAPKLDVAVSTLRGIAPTKFAAPEVSAFCKVPGLRQLRREVPALTGILYLQNFAHM